MTGGSGVLNTLERWSPTLFLVSGVALIGFAVSMAVIIADSPPRSVFGGLGFTLSFLGLLGLYPGLADESPLLARAGSVFAVLGAVGFTMLFVTGVTQVAGMAPPAWPDPLQILNIAGILLGFLLFGVASLRTDAHARTLGVLLLMPSLVFAVNFVRVAVLGAWSPSWAPALLGGLQALAMLSIGYVLRAESVSHESAERPTDTAA